MLLPIFYKVSSRVTSSNFDVTERGKALVLRRWLGAFSSPLSPSSLLSLVEVSGHWQEKERPLSGVLVAAWRRGEGEEKEVHLEIALPKPISSQVA